MKKVRTRVYFDDVTKAKVDSILEYLGLTVSTETVPTEDCGHSYCTGHSETYLTLEEKDSNGQKAQAKG